MIAAHRDERRVRRRSVVRRDDDAPDDRVEPPLKRANRRGGHGSRGFADRKKPDAAGSSELQRIDRARRRRAGSGGGDSGIIQL
jgi:hypothetical protein